MLINWASSIVLTISENNVCFKRNKKNWIGRDLPLWGKKRPEWEK